MLAMRDCKLTYKEWASLRSVLLEVSVGLARVGSDHAPEFDKYTTVIHYVAMKTACEEVGSLREVRQCVPRDSLSHRLSACIRIRQRD